MSKLNNAVAIGDLETVRKLIEDKGYSPNHTGLIGYNDTPLVIAAQFGQRKAMDYLISKGADINAKSAWFGSSPIEAALKFGHIQAIVTLLVHDAKLPDHLHKTDMANELLLKAAGSNDTWSIQNLLSHTEANINIHDSFMKRTPLHNAVMSDSYDATCKLIEQGAKVNAVDIHNWTPLHYAASNSDLQYTKLLLDKGAKVNAQDYTGRTPLFAAMQMGGEEELIKLFVKHGAKINHTDNEGISVLDLAIINDDADMIKCLVSNGAKISAGISGNTPLEDAASQGKLQAIEALLEVGSSLNHKNIHGKTALELAFKVGELGAVNMLKLHGAEVPQYVQEKLDKMNVMTMDEVLPSDIITSPAVNIITEDHIDINSTNTTQPTAQPIIGPIYIGGLETAPDQNENYV